MAVNDLIVYARTESLLYRLYPVLVNYPKSEKFTLCQDIKQCLYNMLSYLDRANSVKSKRFTYAQEADGHLKLLKVLLNRRCYFTV